MTQNANKTREVTVCDPSVKSDLKRAISGAGTQGVLMVDLSVEQKCLIDQQVAPNETIRWVGKPDRRPHTILRQIWGSSLMTIVLGLIVVHSLLGWATVCIGLLAFAYMQFRRGKDETYCVTTNYILKFRKDGVEAFPLEQVQSVRYEKMFVRYFLRVKGRRKAIIF